MKKTSDNGSYVALIHQTVGKEPGTKTVIRDGSRISHICRHKKPYPDTFLLSWNLEPLAYYQCGNEETRNNTRQVLTQISEDDRKRLLALHAGESYMLHLFFEKEDSAPVYLVRRLTPAGDSIHGFYLFTLVHQENGKSSVVKSIEDPHGKTEEQKNDFDPVYRELDHVNHILRQKTEFISMMSHEFRTPLSAIQAACDILQNYGDRLSQKERDEKFDRIRMAIRKTVYLLDDVLSLSKAESGALEVRISSVEPGAMIRSILEDLQENRKVEGKEIRLVGLEQFNRINTDERFLEHIISNLLSNALKYTPESGVVELRLMRFDQGIRIVVKDNGIGIPESAQSSLFQPFYRADNVGPVSGSGLGLSIIDRFVQLLDGRIWFTSSQGQGTEFTIELPWLPASSDSEIS